MGNRNCKEWGFISVYTVERVNGYIGNSDAYSEIKPELISWNLVLPENETIYGLN
jgi:hypothetical protein